MKLLFTGPVLDFSGFAHASRGFLRSLNESSQLDIVVRPLKYDRLDSPEQFEKPDWLDPLLNKDLQDVEMSIQMTTCNVEAEPVPGIINGLYSFFETDRIQPAWAMKANQFDFLIVASRSNAETLVRSGVSKPIIVAAPPCNKEVFGREYEALDLPGKEGKTVFYNICQLSNKKGIDILLRAYYAAFAAMPNDTLLVLKTYVNMANRQNELEAVKQYILNIRERCRIPVNEFPKVLPLVYTMSDEEINRLHETGDAYVCSSRAEGWCLPAFDALCHGNTLISHASGGLADFVNQENSLVYGGCQSLFFDMPHPDPGLFTGIEQCFEPSAAELAMYMQRFHLLKKASESGELNANNNKEWLAILDRRKNGQMLADKLDYRVTSEPIVEQLMLAFNSFKETGKVVFNQEQEVAQ